MTQKWRRINADATGLRRIDVDTTTFWHQMPTAMGIPVLVHHLGTKFIVGFYGWKNAFSGHKLCFTASLNYYRKPNHATIKTNDLWG